MKRPAIQLYFGDWLRNAKLRRCSWAARGVLVEVMALMHDSDEYGALRWPLADIAQAIGCPPALVKELAQKGVLKGADKRVEAYRWAPSHAGKRGPEVLLVPEQDGPIWYSSRMVRDEYKRTNRGLSTRFKPDETASQKLPTTPPDSTPSGTPSRGNGDGNGSGNGLPSQREGAGASSAVACTSIGLTEPMQKSAGASRSETSTAGHKNGLESQRLKALGQWRNLPDLAAKAAAIVGLSAGRGESTNDLVQRIDQRLGELQRRA